MTLGSHLRQKDHNNNDDDDRKGKKKNKQHQQKTFLKFKPHFFAFNCSLVTLGISLVYYFLGVFFFSELVGSRCLCFRSIISKRMLSCSLTFYHKFFFF